MNIKKLFLPFRQKLFWENVFKSLLFAAISCAATVFVTSLIYHIFIKETPLLIILISGGSAFIATLLLIFFLRFPTKKRVAVRMDEIGLEERVSTMLEYQKEDKEIFVIQRRDAQEHISKASAKQMKFRFKKREFIVCGISILLAAVMLVLPYNIFVFGESDIVSEQQQQIIKDLIAELREEVKNSEISEELKNSLNEIIDELEEDLENTDSELEQAAKIEQAKQKMEELLSQALTKDKIGEALQRYELTRALGEAISDGDTEKVSTALSTLETSLKDDSSLVTTLSETLLAALSNSGVDASDSLYIAIDDFSSSLSALNIESDSFESELETVFDTADAAINAALTEQAAIEEEMNKLEEGMSDAKDELLGNEKESSESASGEEGEGSEGEQPEGEQPEGEKPEGEMPEGEMPEGGMEGEGGEGEEGALMTEGIYDPVSGSVSYGEVFAVYYAQYLAALEAGEVPEDLQEIIDEYYSSLN